MAVSLNAVRGSSIPLLDRPRQVKLSLAQVNFKSGKWKFVATMSSPAVCCLSGYVFIVGGHNDSGALASVERLNMDKEKWRFVCSLDKPLVYHAGAAYKHKVYISGGIEEGVVTSRVQCYRPAKDKWENKSPMLSGDLDQSLWCF